MLGSPCGILQDASIEGYGEERLSEWMFHWAKVRHDEAAERTLLTAVACGLRAKAD